MEKKLAEDVAKRLTAIYMYLEAIEALCEVASMEIRDGLWNKYFEQTLEEVRGKKDQISKFF